MTEFIYLDGRYLPADVPNLMHTNRAVRYGDALFETIHACGAMVHFFDKHYQRLVKSSEKVGLVLPGTATREQLEEAICHLMLKNKLFKGGRVRLTAFRSGVGLYTPETDPASIMIECAVLPDPDYTLNKQGYRIALYPDIKKPINALSSVKSANALLFVMAARWRKENGFDDVLVMNEEGCICESMSSNIFWVKENQLYTPSESTGCLPGIMRGIIIGLAPVLQMELTEVKHPTTAELIDAEEIFPTNAIQGIRWVVAFRDRKYYNTVAKKMILLLNNQLSENTKAIA